MNWLLMNLIESIVVLIKLSMLKATFHTAPVAFFFVEMFVTLVQCMLNCNVCVCFNLFPFFRVKSPFNR